MRVGLLRWKNDHYIRFTGTTIITFDLQLYIKATRLQKKIDPERGFVFHVSYFELHIVYCVLKVTGKTIDKSGLDQAFEEAGKQIIDYVVYYHAQEQPFKTIAA